MSVFPSFSCSSYISSASRAVLVHCLGKAYKHSFVITVVCRLYLQSTVNINSFDYVINLNSLSQFSILVYPLRPIVGLGGVLFVQIVYS